ncbi:MAG TPA: hypothetical protein VF021_12065 [Longimicrobiales bacterium]
MNLRRRITGLIALIALVFSFAETARAASCELAAPFVPAHSQAPMPGHMPAGSHHESMPNCPFSAAGQIGCSAAVSLPATYTSLAAPLHEEGLFFSSDAVLPHAVRTTAIFHPPRF